MVGIDRQGLDSVARQFAKATIEYSLRKALDSVAGEMPPEVVDEIYWRIYRPVMLAAMKSIARVVSRG